MRRTLVTMALALTMLGAAPVAPAADEGILLGATQELRVSGRMLDSKTGQPLAEAQVTVEGPYQNDRAPSGPDGTFTVTARAEAGLGNVSIVFSHADYQQKFLETVLRDAFPGRVDVAVGAGRATVKGKKLDVDVSCGSNVQVATRYDDPTTFKVICEGGLSGVEFEIRKNRIAVLASGPFTLRLENGSLQIRDSKNTAIEMRVDAAMLPR